MGVAGLVWVAAAFLGAHCIEVKQACDSTWDVDYMNGAPMIKHLVVLDMTGPRDSNQTDCFYKHITKSRFSLVVLDDSITAKNSDAVNIKLKFRSNDLAFIVLLPYPDMELLMYGHDWKLFQWHKRAIVEIVIFKLVVDENTNELVKKFINIMLEELKLVEVVVIVLKPKQMFFTYDQNSMRLSKDFSCDVVHSEKPFNHSILSKNLYKMRVNYPTKIVSFYRAPSTLFMHELSDMLNVLSRGANGLGGKDGFLMADIVRHLGLAPIYSTPEGVEPFGTVLPNGSVTGVLRLVTAGEVDLSGNSRFLTAYGIEDQYYYIAYNHFDMLCGIVKKSALVPLWVQIGQTYSLVIWSLLFIQTTLIAALRWVHYKTTFKRRSMLELLVETFCSYIVPVASVQKSVQKVLLLGNLLVCIIFVSILQGSIRSAFTKRKYYSDIDTLEELDQQYNKIYAPLMEKNLIFGEGNSELYDRLNNKVVSDAFAFELIVEDVIENNIALVMPALDFGAMASVKLAEIEQQLHIMRECPRLYLYSFIANIEYPWVTEVEATTLRLVEAGLAQWYYALTLEDLRLRARRPAAAAPAASVLPLAALDGPFYIYGAGLLISTILFVLEYYQSPILDDL